MGTKLHHQRNKTDIEQALFGTTFGKEPPLPYNTTDNRENRSPSDLDLTDKSGRDDQLAPTATEESRRSHLGIKTGFNFTTASI